MSQLSIVPPINGSPNDDQVDDAIRSLKLDVSHPDRVIAAVTMGKWVGGLGAANYATHILVDRIEFWKKSGGISDSQFFAMLDAISKEGSSKELMRQINSYIEFRLNADRLIMDLCKELVAIAGSGGKKDKPKSVVRAAVHQPDP